MSAKTRRRAEQRQLVIDAIEAAGYAVRFVEWCEDHRTPGMIPGYFAGVTDHTHREVKVRSGQSHAWTLAVLSHELEHVLGAERGTDHPDHGLACGGCVNAFGETRRT